MIVAAALALVACDKEKEQQLTETFVVTFEEGRLAHFVADYVGSAYSSDVVTPDYVWECDYTKLTSYPITIEWDGVSYLSGGFAISSYCSNDLEAFNDYGAYLKDLYVYNANYKYGSVGGGNNNSNNFLVGYGNYEGTEEGAEDDYRPTLEFSDGKARTIKGCYVNATAYFVSITELGNEFSPALKAGEKITLTATGYDEQGAKTGSVTMTLAEKGNITKSWRAWDLSTLGPVAKVRFNITGGPTDEWGMMSPKYFALDDITIEWEKE